MATDAIVTLERLRCIKESDGTGHSEPYMWPVLVSINTTNANVNVSSLALGNARIVIDQDIREGQIIVIPSSINTLRLRLNEAENVKLILSVVMWENDETPEAALKAGFQAYSGELKAAIIANLLALQAAQGNPQAEAAVRAIIEKRVKDKVEDAIKGALTTGQKIRIGLGTLNMDDVVGSDSESLGTVGTTARTQNFTLAFRNESGSESYEIMGNLAVRPVPVDPCQAQANAVRSAQATLDGLENQIRSLQEELQSAPPGQKPGILAMIREVRQELTPAKAALQRAKQALQTCRNQSSILPTINESAEV